ncbi:MAG: glycosyltransferase family 87 protein [Candidatus Zixiibacteriota bacterium]
MSDIQPTGESADVGSKSSSRGSKRYVQYDDLRHLGRISLIVLAVVVGLVFAWGYGWISWHKAQQPWVTDLAKFYMSARQYLDGGDIYDEIPYSSFGPMPPELTTTRENFHPNLNPPFQTLVFAPLVRFDFRTVYWVWLVLSVGCGVAATLRLSRETGNILTHWAGPQVQTPLLLYALFCSFPTLIGLTLGQFSMILYLLVVSAWIAVRRGHEVAGGVLCGLAISLKPFTGMYLLLFLFLRRWRLSAACGLSVLACTSGAALALGIDSHLRYLEILQGLTWFGSGWNASLLGFFAPIFGGSENVSWMDWPVVSHGLSLAIGVAGIALMGRLAHRSRSRSDHLAVDLGFALAGPLMLLTSLLGWNYYFPILLLSAAVGVKYSREIENGRRWRILIVVAWLLSVFCYSPVMARDMSGPLLWFTYPALDTYALVLMFIAVAGVHLAYLRSHLPHTVPSKKLV